MKKTITTLLILFLTLGLFAETGYAGFEWGANKSEFSYLNTEDKNTLSEQKVMLNKETTRFFHFGNTDMLWGISYSLPAAKTDEIKSKFKNLVRTQKLKEMPEEAMTEALKNLALEENEKNKDYVSNRIMAAFALAYSAYGIPETVKEGIAAVSAYDYNDDTRVFIFENMVKDKTIVVYTYHEQDY